MKGEVIHRPKLLVILGPTASGKTKLAVRLAREFNGEIVSADSRQVYRGLDVGTGKDLKEYRTGGPRIPYHLIDVADPKKDFNLAQYQKLAKEAIKKIIARGRLPILVGGSGLYLQAVVDNYTLAEVQPDPKQRAELARLSAAQLFERLEKIKPDFAARLNNSDRNNLRRLVRYLEIARSGAAGLSRPGLSPYDCLILGLKILDSERRERISFRLLERLEKEGLVAEVADLHQSGLSWERLESFGLEYRFISRHLQGKLSYREMVEQLTTASYHFAKRQLTWFRRWERQGRKIVWIKAGKQAEKTVKKWLRKPAVK